MSKTPATDRLAEMAVYLLDVQSRHGLIEAAHQALQYKHKLPEGSQYSCMKHEEIIEEAESEARRKPGRTARRVVALKAAISEIIMEAEINRGWSAE